MSVRHIYENAPLGALIAYSDGSPQPPDEPRERIAEWYSRNGLGPLVAKHPAAEYPFHTEPPTITLRVSEYGDNAPLSKRKARTFTTESDLTFWIVNPPCVGEVRILRDIDGVNEMLHLALDRAAAERWLAENPDPDIRLEEVTADEIAAHVVEGRAA